MDSSPCVNAGSTVSAIEVGELDLNGNARINKTIDIGAFESLITI